MLDTKKTKNRATVHTHDPLHIHATIGGLAIDARRAEGIVRRWRGSSRIEQIDDVCVFPAPNSLPDIFGIVELTSSTTS